MIIDTRMRPMWGEFARQFTPGACAPFFRKIGMNMPESVQKSSEEDMIREMDEAGIAVGIATNIHPHNLREPLHFQRTPHGNGRTFPRALRRHGIN